VKDGRARLEQPTEVRLARRTQLDLPCIAGEPAPLAARRRDDVTAGRRREATDVKDDAVGVGEGVLVCALDADSLAVACQPLAAARTDEDALGRAVVARLRALVDRDDRRLRRRAKRAERRETGHLAPSTTPSWHAKAGNACWI